MFFYSRVFFLKASFFLLIFALAVSCFPRLADRERETVATVIKSRSSGEDSERSYEDSDRDNDRRDRDSRSSECRRDSSYSEEVSVTELRFVDSNNVGDYLLQGRCEETNELVYVTVNGHETRPSPKCSRGRWKMELNLTNVVTEGPSMVFKIEHNGDSICHEVRVAFLGPEDYIPVPPLEDYYEDGFYVMKYEAKVVDRGGSSARAISAPKGLPIMRASYQEALDLCENNGSRYGLMRNSQWQNIARSIEKEHKNWSQGRSIPSDDNALNCGVFLGRPMEASSNDENDCAVKSCDSGWDEKRRTHLLTNGERIWDMCGNVGEIMKDKYQKKEDFDNYIYKMPFSLKKLFGPKKTYKLVEASRRDNAWNLGYAEIKKKNDLIVRGLPGRKTGIFSVDITKDQDGRRGYSSATGFRCVYVP